MECETDYDDHILNYVLHINKHHISFAVIFKAFPPATLQSKHLTQHELMSPRVQDFFCYIVIRVELSPIILCGSIHLILGDI